MDKRIETAVLETAKAKGKKYKMTFLDKDDKKVTSTNFGARGYEDFPSHKDTERRDRYLARHAKDPKDPTSAGQLSRMILWGDKPSIQAQLD